VSATLEFTITHRCGDARAGLMRTPHGRVETPVFMPVGTRAAVKAVTNRDLVDAGAQMVLANTYHLHLRPGDDLIARHGGLHRFMSWDRPILTDSGGYQVFSLAAMRDVDDQGVRFRSPLDGAAHAISPETATDIQARLGSDIAMVLDECVSSPAAPDEARAAMERSARWAARGRARFRDIGGGAADVQPLNPGQAQFGIIQGGVYPDLRRESVQRTTEIGFEAYAIGGLSVGEPPDVMYEVVAHTAALLPDDRPRYLMGTGMPDDLFECVARGIDMFDCVLPTRNARNGQLLTREGRLVIKNARYAEDQRPPDPECGCYTCRNFSRAYLRHLFLSHEMTAGTLNSLHNLYFYLDTMKRIREAIVFGTFENLRQEFLRTFSRRSITT
jgi:queuine tRNA-ribosyltransferase